MSNGVTRPSPEATLANLATKLSNAGYTVDTEVAHRTCYVSLTKQGGLFAQDLDDVIEALGRVAHSLLPQCWEPSTTVPADYKYVPHVRDTSPKSLRVTLVLVPNGYDDGGLQERLRESLASPVERIGINCEFHVADEFCASSGDFTRVWGTCRGTYLYKRTQPCEQGPVVWKYGWEDRLDRDDPAGDVVDALREDTDWKVLPGDIVQQSPGYRSDGLKLIGREGVARSPIALGNGEAGIPAWAVALGLARGATLAQLLKTYSENTTASFVVYPLELNGVLQTAGQTIQRVAVYDILTGEDYVMEKGDGSYFDDLCGDPLLYDDVFVGGNH